MSHASDRTDRAAFMPRRSTAFATIDFETDGRRTGFIMVPHSPDDDAWGVTRIPIAVVRNGAGPTVVVQGGNHGDEYEGPIAISDLYRTLDPARVRGRLILLPAVNVHAVVAGRRTSPVDGLNLNRIFPGDPLGTNTQEIAAFVADHVLPLGDVFLDLHSGGSSLRMIPSAGIVPARDPDHHRRNVAAAEAFGAPVTLMIDNLGETRTASAQASSLGLVTVVTEMAGGGTVSPEALRLCRRGIERVLEHAGVLEPRGASVTVERSALLKLAGPSAFVYAGANGVFEPFHELGTHVRRGEAAGRIHSLWDLDHPPEPLTYGTDGLLYGVRQPGLVSPGNCCLVVATPYV